MHVLRSPPEDSDADAVLDLSALSARASDISKLHGRLFAQRVGIGIYFRNIVCFLFNKGSRLKQYYIGFDFDLIKVPSCCEPRKVFLEIPSAILRAVAAKTRLDGAPRSHLCIQQVTASHPAQPDSYTWQNQKLVSGIELDSCNQLQTPVAPKRKMQTPGPYGSITSIKCHI